MMISLYEWAKRQKLAYSTATKMFDTGMLTGAVRDGRYTTVPENTPPPVRELVTCAICGGGFPQITGTHLKLHQISVADYKLKFPNIQTISTAVREDIRTKLTGIERSADFAANVSAGRRGIIPLNNPGAYQPGHQETAATRLKRVVAATNRRHDQATKDKISAANQGKVIPRDIVEKSIIAQRLAYERNGHPLKGHITPPHIRAQQKIIAQKREDNYTPERREAINKAIGIGQTGIKRTPEQKIRYTAATLKRMQDHPETFKFLKDTKLEQDFEQWCVANAIQYRKQCFITFNDHQHPYDFYLPDFKLLIECDGPLHWAETWYEPRGGVTKTEAFAAQQRKDKFWTEAAIELGYLIVRLRGLKKVGDEGSGSIKEQMEQWLTEE